MIFFILFWKFVVVFRISSVRSTNQKRCQLRKLITAGENDD